MQHDICTSSGTAETVSIIFVLLDIDSRKIVLMHYN